MGHTNFEVDTALISHIIKDFVWKDSELFVTIEPMDTVQGKLLQDVLDNLSSRRVRTFI